VTYRLILITQVIVVGVVLICDKVHKVRRVLHWFCMCWCALSCSIEDAKQKAEYDKKLTLAEEKKAATRETIEAMREEFQKLLARNNELPPHLALSRKVSAYHLLSGVWVISALAT